MSYLNNILDKKSYFYLFRVLERKNKCKIALRTLLFSVRLTKTAIYIEHNLLLWDPRQIRGNVFTILDDCYEEDFFSIEAKQIARGEALKGFRILQRKMKTENENGKRIKKS